MSIRSNVAPLFHFILNKIFQPSKIYNGSFGSWESCSLIFQISSARNGLSTSRIKFSYQWTISKSISSFRAFLCIWEAYNVWNTYRKVGLSVRLRGLPSFYVKRVARYRTWAFLGLFWATLTFLGIFRHFPASERHTMYETLIEKWVLRSDRGVYQVSTTNG